MECLKLSPESAASLHGMSEAELRAFTGKGNSSGSDSEEDFENPHLCQLPFVRDVKFRQCSGRSYNLD